MVNSEEVNQQLQEAYTKKDFKTVYQLLLADEALELDINQELALQRGTEVLYGDLFYFMILCSHKDNQDNIPEIFDIIELLKKREDLDLTKTTRNSFTFLHCAAGVGNEDVARWLLEKRVRNINQRNSRGYTAFQMAVQKKYFDIARCLLMAFFEDEQILENPEILLNFLTTLSEVEINLLSELFLAMTVEDWAIAFASVATVSEAMERWMNVLGNLPWDIRVKLISREDHEGNNILLIMAHYVSDLRPAIITLLKGFKPLKELFEEEDVRTDPRILVDFLTTLSQVVTNLLSELFLEMTVGDWRIAFASIATVPEAMEKWINVLGSLPRDIRVKIILDENQGNNILLIMAHYVSDLKSAVTTLLKDFDLYEKWKVETTAFQSAVQKKYFHRARLFLRVFFEDEVMRQNPRGFFNFLTSLSEMNIKLQKQLFLRMTVEDWRIAFESVATVPRGIGKWMKMLGNLPWDIRVRIILADNKKNIAMLFIMAKHLRFCQLAFIKLFKGFPPDQMQNIYSEVLRYRDNPKFYIVFAAFLRATKYLNCNDVTKDILSVKDEEGYDVVHYIELYIHNNNDYHLRNEFKFLYPKKAFNKKSGNKNKSSASKKRTQDNKATSRSKEHKSQRDSSREPHNPTDIQFPDKRLELNTSTQIPHVSHLSSSDLCSDFFDREYLAMLKDRLINFLSFEPDKLDGMLSTIQKLPEDDQIQIYSHRLLQEPYWTVLRLAVFENILLLSPLLSAIGCLKSQDAIKNILSEKDDEGHDIEYHIELYISKNSDLSLDDQLRSLRDQLGSLYEKVGGSNKESHKESSTLPPPNNSSSSEGNKRFRFLSGPTTTGTRSRNPSGRLLMSLESEEQWQDQPPHKRARRG